MVPLALVAALATLTLLIAMRRMPWLSSSLHLQPEYSSLQEGAPWPTTGSTPGIQRTKDEQLAYERNVALQVALESIAVEDIQLDSVVQHQCGQMKIGNLSCESSQMPTFIDVAQQVKAPYRKRSIWPACRASLGPRDDPNFLSSVRPCGNLSSICTDIPLVEANKDYPGGGIGAVIPGQDYIVQFDIGLHAAVASEILKRQLKEVDSCLHCPPFKEQCLEAVVTGGAMWGNLGLRSMATRAYDCMGGCGKGCSNVVSTSREDIGALDCLKHDLCSAWKSVRLGRATRGFCHDPDCGDEAAMSIFNCWKGFRLFGSVGGNRRGPFAEPAICEDGNPRIRGCWNHGGWFTKGRCKVFQGWRKGQGIPDPHPLRSIIQRL